MDPWPKGIFAVAIFVEDLDASKDFYQRAFGLPVHFEDDDSVAFMFGDTLHRRGRRRGRDVRRVDRTTSGVAERPDGSALGDPNRQLSGPRGSIWEIARIKKEGGRLWD
jgi:catechol 2,3-dioxygenase-like lactoylglutathione lyase family enzyme